MPCIRCGCEGEFKNMETGEIFLLTSAILENAAFLKSDRTCFCVTCPKGRGEQGCESMDERMKRVENSSKRNA
jgi:hypothetical protein